MYNLSGNKNRIGGPDPVFTRRKNISLKRWQLWIGLAISAVFLWLALRGLQLAEVWAEMLAADYVWLLPGIVAYFIAVWARTWRWDYMLRPLKHIPLRRLFPVVVIGYMGNNVYPLRAGEVLRSYVLQRQEEVPMSASLATVIVERVFDGLVMLLFVFIALPFAPTPGSAERWLVTIASAAFFAALLLFFALAAMPERALRLVAFVTTWPVALPESYSQRIVELAERFLFGLESLRRFRNVLMIFVTSVVIWLLETLKYWFVMQAFSFEVSFFALMLMNGIVNLFTTLPSAPGYVGTFDKPGIDVLVRYGVAPKVATAYTLVLHAALWLPVTLLGVFYMIRGRLGWSVFSQARQVAEREARA